MFNAKEAVSRRVLQQILVLSILVVWVKVENKVLKTQSKYSPYCRLFGNSGRNLRGGMLKTEGNSSIPQGKT